MSSVNSFHAATTLTVGDKSYRIYKIDSIEAAGAGSVLRRKQFGWLASESSNGWIQHLGYI